MARQAFRFGERHGGGADASEGAAADVLNRRHPHEVRGAQAAARRRGSAGRQHVIRPGDVVAARLGAQRAHEHGAGPRQARGDGVVVADGMLRRQPLAERDRLGQAAREHDAAVALQRGGGRPGGRQLPDDLGLDVAGQAR